MTNATNTKRWLAGGGLVLLALTSLGCADESANPPSEDVSRSWSCQAGDDGIARATGSVTNHSSKPSFYILTIDFAVDGRSFDSVTASVDDVAPGETSDVEAASFDDAPGGELDCFVSGVDRFKA